MCVCVYVWRRHGGWRGALARRMYMEGRRLPGWALTSCVRHGGGAPADSTTPCLPAAAARCARRLRSGPCASALVGYSHALAPGKKGADPGRRTAAPSPAPLVQPTASLAQPSRPHSVLRGSPAQHAERTAGLCCACCAAASRQNRRRRG